MRNLLLLIAVAGSSVAYGQKKKSTKNLPPPPIVMPTKAEPPQSLAKEDNSKKCFVYVNEVPKDSMVAVTENLLEYFPSGSNARMIITTYQYDPEVKKKLSGSGETLAQTQQLQFIEGKYTIEKGTLTMTPNKKDQFEPRRFNLVNKPKTQTLLHLKDEQNHLYKKRKCLEPMISL